MTQFYENKLPSKGDLVMVKVKSVDDTGAQVFLLEYGINAMIQYNQLSRRKIRSIKNVIRVGEIDVAEVILIESEKGYIDLSKKSVTSDEKEEKQKEWVKTKAIDAMLESASRRIKYPKEKIYEESIWPLYREFENEDLNIYNIFELFLVSPELFKSENKEIQEDIIKQVNQKLSTPPKKYQTDIKLTCWHHEDGIEMIKKALMIAVYKGFDARYIASPIYSITKDYVDEDKAKEELTAICEEIKEFITKNGGDMEIDKEARVLK